MAQRKYQVVIAPEARDDLKREVTYIRRKWSNKRARYVQNGLLDAVDSLDTAPRRHGKHTALSNEEREYRFLPKWAYLIVYRIEDALMRVRVVSIFHTSRNPDDLEEIKGR